MNSEFEGLWVETNVAGRTSSFSAPTTMQHSAVAVVFHNWRVYFGISGQTKQEIIDNKAGAGIPGGSEFRLGSNLLIIIDKQGKENKYRREGTTFWMGASELRKVSD